VESLTEELTKIDDTVPELPLKDVVSIFYGLTIHSKLTHIPLNRSFASTETYDSAKILHPTKYVLEGFRPQGRQNRSGPCYLLQR
jgi:hypothetical protein